MPRRIILGIMLALVLTPNFGKADTEPEHFRLVDELFDVVAEGTYGLNMSITGPRCFVHFSTSIGPNGLDATFNATVTLEDDCAPTLHVEDVVARPAAAIEEGDHHACLSMAWLSSLGGATVEHCMDWTLQRDGIDSWSIYAQGSDVTGLSTPTFVPPVITEHSWHATGCNSCAHVADHARAWTQVYQEYKPLCGGNSCFRWLHSEPHAFGAKGYGYCEYEGYETPPYSTFKCRVLQTR